MRTSRWLSVLTVFVLFAAACGDTDGDSGGASAETSETSAGGGADTASDEPETSSETTAGASATTDGSDADGAAAPTGTFRYAGSLAPPTWDPHIDARAFVMTYYAPLYDGLLNENPDGSLVAGLATDWELTDTEARFMLREGVTFHDGTPFDADAVKYNIEKAQATPGANGVALSSIDEVQVVSPTEVVFVLNQPDRDLLRVLARQSGLMISPNVAPEDVATGTPAGTGPFMIETATEDRATFVYNPDYFDPTQPGVAQLEFIVLGDDAARMNALTTGEVDAAFIRASQVGEAEGAGLTVEETTANVSIFQVVDIDGQNIEALGDERVRQALAHAIDRDAWTEAVNRGYGTQTNQLFQEGSPWHIEGYEGYPYDPDRARELLAEAGATDLTLVTTSWGPFNLGNQVLQQMFADVGVGVDITEGAPGGDIQAVQAFEAFSTYTLMPDVHPDTVWGKHFAPNSTWNPSGGTVVGLDEARDAAAADQEEAASDEAYREMLQIAYDSGWLVPIHTNVSLIAFDGDAFPNLEGWEQVVTGFNARTVAPAG